MHATGNKKKNIKYELKVINWLFTFARSHKTSIGLSLMFMLMAAGLEIAVPYLTKIAVDNYITPNWGVLTFSNDIEDIRLEKRIKNQYPSSVIALNKDTYLIDISRLSTEDKYSVEKLSSHSENKYLVIDGSKIKSDRLARVQEIVKRHPQAFKRKGNLYYAEYNSLEELSHRELEILRSEQISKIGKLALLVILCLFAIFVFGSLYTYILSYSGQRLMHRIRLSVFSHILTLPQSYFDRNPVGTVTTRVTNDVNAIIDMYTSVLIQSIRDILLIFGVIGVMFYMDRGLTLIILSLISLIVIIGIVFRIRFKTVYRNVRKTIANVNAFVQESIRGIVLIKLYNKEGNNFERFNKVNTESYKANMDELSAVSKFTPIVEFAGISSAAIVLWYGSMSVVKLDISLGAFIAYLYYILMLFRPILEMSERYNRIYSAIAASENLYDIVNLEAEDNEPKGNIEKFRGKIEFKNVWFSYNDNDWVLRDVSFRVDPGETAALVGLTGSGKSTVVNLILRFYDIQKGQVLIDGSDINKFSADFLRQNISAVFQDTFLYEKNIPISLGDKSAELYNYLHGDDKSERFSASSGEQQLASLVGAIEKDAKILILDEATSNIDAQIESKLHDLIREDFDNRTKLIISHRPSNARSADSIIVIHEGKIVEVGSHSELIEKQGFYYNLFKLEDEIQHLSS
jgi:ATP-binding cassette subfamily B multidrug efflux pump